MSILISDSGQVHAYKKIVKPLNLGETIVAIQTTFLRGVQ